MDIVVETKKYNHRRYGKPWIALVDFSASTKGEFAWGQWTGDHYNGGEGVLTISANPGDIIAKGQKDHRQPCNSAPTFYVVDADADNGKGFVWIGDKGAAYKYYLERKNTSPDPDALIHERETLLARIREIDAIIND